MPRCQRRTWPSWRGRFTNTTLPHGQTTVFLFMPFPWCPLFAILPQQMQWMLAQSWFTAGILTKIVIHDVKKGQCLSLFSFRESWLFLAVSLFPWEDSRYFSRIELKKCAKSRQVPPSNEIAKLFPSRLFQGAFKGSAPRF